MGDGGSPFEGIENLLNLHNYDGEVGAAIGFRSGLSACRPTRDSPTVLAIHLVYTLLGIAGFLATTTLMS